jgi:hypothetical protein
VHWGRLIVLWCRPLDTSVPAASCRFAAVSLQAFIAAHEVMEVRRTLYFCDDLGRHGSSRSSSQGNRNIGGMLRVSFADTR